MRIEEMKKAAASLQKLAAFDMPIKYAIELVDLINRFNEIMENNPEDDEEVDIKALILPPDIPVWLSAAEVHALQHLIEFRSQKEETQR